MILSLISFYIFLPFKLLDKNVLGLGHRYFIKTLAVLMKDYVFASIGIILIDLA